MALHITCTSICFVVCAMLLLLSRAHGGPLEDYVNRFDPHYKYEVLKKYTYKGPDFTMYILNMTSQKWMDETVTTTPIWWHYMAVVVPDVLVHADSGFLFIDEGHNDDSPPTIDNIFIEMTIMIAVSTGCIGADIRMIPNQPITFLADPSHRERSAEPAIAWTWSKFIENSTDPEILLYLPMTKASVRGLDTIASFAKDLLGTHVDKFYVAGGSKRGWTTWLTAAVDSRVKAISPIVMDLLNMVKNLHHHYRAYNGWSFALKEYYEVNFTSHIDDPNTQKMADIIDPISYKSRLTIPKLVINAGGDEFFLPDDCQYYFADIKGPTYLRMIPNADHTCVGHAISLFFTMRSFFLAEMEGYPLPQVSWTKEKTDTGGRLTVTTDRRPKTIRCFWAETLDGQRRDFRLIVADPVNPKKEMPHPVFWRAMDVTTMRDFTYRVDMEYPRDGWKAFFIEMSFSSTNGSVLEFTTETFIIPETFPVPDCVGSDCRGTLV